MSAVPAVLVAYATRQGFTREVAETIATELEQAGVPAELRAAGAVGDLSVYTGVVLGSPLYTGRWHRDMRRMLHRHRHALANLPVAVFALGPRTLDPEEVAASRAQLDHSLAGVPEITPVAVAVFGGAIDPARLRFPFNRMPASDARDWVAIRAWAAEIAPLVAGRVTAPR
jgi:menaquinone-dependent protoporphyrinogen oxidase